MVSLSLEIKIIIIIIPSMKKLLVVVCTLMLSVSAMAQQTIESQITELKQKIEAAATAERTLSTCE